MRKHLRKPQNCQPITLPMTSHVRLRATRARLVIHLPAAAVVTRNSADLVVYRATTSGEVIYPDPRGMCFIILLRSYKNRVAGNKLVNNSLSTECCSFSNTFERSRNIASAPFVPAC